MYSAAVLTSTYTSVIIQFITGVIGAIGLFLPLAPEHQILKSVLLKETIVQVIEFCAYVFIIMRFNLETMAATRYFDWVFTTPVMLFTTMIYFKYTEMREKKQDTTQLTTGGFIKDNYKIILLILVANMGMLVSGYLGEIQVLDKYVACIVGFLFFAVSFGILYREYARESKVGKMLYAFLVSIWSLYGIAFLMRADFKNIAINGLDILAKNFFGVFLFVIIYLTNKKEKQTKQES